MAHKAVRAVAAGPMWWWAWAEAEYALSGTVTRMGVNGPSTANKFCVEHVQRLRAGISHPGSSVYNEPNPHEAVSLCSRVTRGSPPDWKQAGQPLLGGGLACLPARGPPRGDGEGASPTAAWAVPARRRGPAVGLTRGGAVPRRPAGPGWVPPCGCYGYGSHGRTAAARRGERGGRCEARGGGLGLRGSLRAGRVSRTGLPAPSLALPLGPFAQLIRYCHCPSGTRRWLEASSGENMAVA